MGRVPAAGALAGMEGRRTAHEFRRSEMQLEPRGHVQESAEPVEDHRRYSWYHKAGAVIAIVFCFEVGVFFVVFPWLPYWDSNFLGTFSERWSKIWTDPYFRGAVSGLGLVNIYISLLEMFRLRRFSEPVD